MGRCFVSQEMKAQPNSASDESTAWVSLMEGLEATTTAISIKGTGTSPTEGELIMRLALRMERSAGSSDMSMMRSVIGAMDTAQWVNGNLLTMSFTKLVD